MLTWFCNPWNMGIVLYWTRESIALLTWSTKHSLFSTLSSLSVVTSDIARRTMHCIRSLKCRSVALAAWFGPSWSVTPGQKLDLQNTWSTCYFVTGWWTSVPLWYYGGINTRSAWLFLMIVHTVRSSISYYTLCSTVAQVRCALHSLPLAQIQNPS